LISLILNQKNRKGSVYFESPFIRAIRSTDTIAPSDKNIEMLFL